MNFLRFVAVTGSLVLPALAQNGRSMRLLAPAVIGQQAAFAARHPVSAAGNLYALLWCDPPSAGAAPVTWPGFVTAGLVRVDLLTSVVAAVGLLDASGQSPAFVVPVPNVASLVGHAWDLQAVDWHLPSGTLTFADDELAMTVAAPPSPSHSLAAIPPGSFVMGSGAHVATFPWTAVELPLRTVTISRPFWMGRYEVTQAEYQAVMGQNPSLLLGPLRPVERVSWFDATAYCSALSAQESAAGRLPTGYEYRLPTEAEWEYCCRAGATTEWSVGASIGCGQANLFDGVYCVSHPTLGGQSTPVGSYAGNGFGLHDLHGNVLEWCRDGWDGLPYVPGAAEDPHVASGPVRILRGGSWDSYAVNCRAAVRFGYDPAGTVHLVGFRVVCAPILP